MRPPSHPWAQLADQFPCQEQSCCGVDDDHESGHILKFPKKNFDTLLVANNHTDPPIIDGVDNGINSKGGIDSCDANTLGWDERRRKRKIE